MIDLPPWLRTTARVDDTELFLEELDLLVRLGLVFIEVDDDATPRFLLTARGRDASTPDPLGFRSRTA